MRQQTTGLLLLLLLSPTLALASGNDIIPTLYLFAGSLVLAFALLLALRLPIAEKVILAAIYLLTMWAVLYGIKDLPFTENRAFVNSAIGLAPALTTVGTWLLLRRRKRRGKE